MRTDLLVVAIELDAAGAAEVDPPEFALLGADEEAADPSPIGREMLEAEFIEVEVKKDVIGFGSVAAMEFTVVAADEARPFCVV